MITTPDHTCIVHTADHRSPVNCMGIDAGGSGLSAANLEKSVSSPHFASIGAPVNVMAVPF